MFLNFGKLTKIARLPYFYNKTRFCFSEAVNNKTHIVDNKFLDFTGRIPDVEVFTILVHWPFDFPTVLELQRISSYLLLADGAANFYYRSIKEFGLKDVFLPNAVIGDFDSSRSDALVYFESLGVSVKKDHNQNNTDLEKCMSALIHWIDTSNPLDPNKSYKLVIGGGLGGRADHVFSNISICQKYTQYFAKKHDSFSIMLIDNNSIGTCLLPGKTIYKRSKRFELPTGCGIFPLNNEARVTTKGFRWNLTEECPLLKFGTYASSSNEMIEDSVEINSDSPVFFTTTTILHEGYKKLKGELTFKGIKNQNGQSGKKNVILFK